MDEAARDRRVCAATRTVAQVVYSARSLAHIECAFQYLGERNPAAALDAVTAIQSAVDNLQAHPLIGRRIECEYWPFDTSENWAFSLNQRGGIRSRGGECGARHTFKTRQFSGQSLSITVSAQVLTVHPAWTFDGEPSVKRDFQADVSNGKRGALLLAVAALTLAGCGTTSSMRMEPAAKASAPTARVNPALEHS